MNSSIVDRVKNIVLTPATEWPVIEKESATQADLYKNYIMLLAAIPVIAGFLGGFVFGYSMGPLGTIHIGFFSGIASAIAQYILALVMIFAVSLLVSNLAPNFGGVRDDLQALKLTAYAYTPVWVAGIFGLLPGLRFLGILGLWGLYVFYLGAPRLMKLPEDKAVTFTAVVVVATIVLAIVLGAIVHIITPGPGMGFM